MEALSRVEQWRPVVGFECRYAVSNNGSVRSVDRKVPHPTAKSGFIRLRGKERKPVLNPVNGYLAVVLYKENQSRGFAVHQLVALAFLPDPPGPIGRGPDKWAVDHIDEDRLNNSAENLQWLTNAANASKASKGANNAKNKLQPEQVRAIREDSRPEIHIATDYGISRSLVGMIRRRQAWAHLP